MKKLVYALIFVALVVAVGYWYLKKSIPSTGSIKSAESYIPSDATALLRLNTVKIRDLVIDESFKSPKKMKDLYDDLNSLKGKVEIPTKEVEFFIKNGLNLPDQFLAFEFTNGNSSFLAAIFPIKSHEKFKAALNERKYDEITDGTYFLPKENLGIFVDGDLCFFMYSEKASVQSLLSATNMLMSTKDSAPAVATETFQSHFSLKIGHDSPFVRQLTDDPSSSVIIEGNHLKGRTKFDVNFLKKDTTSRSIFFPNLKTIDRGDSLIANVSLGLNLKEFSLSDVLNTKQLSDINKSLAAIQGDVSDVDKIWNGQLSFVLRKPKELKEKFVTYTFDDNFEKVEKVQWKSSTNPDFEMLLGLKDGGTKHLRNKSWLTNNEFNAYPLQKVYYTETTRMAHLTTDPNLEVALDAQPINSQSAIDINIDVQQLVEHYPQLFKAEDLKQIKKSLKQINVTDLYSKEGEKIIIDIEYVNQSQNGLISLMELMSKTGNNDPPEGSNEKEIVQEITE